MSDPDLPDEMAESSIDSEIVELAAERTDADLDEIADALVVLHADLIGRHGEYERTGEYVTVDGTRAYRVPSAEWDDLLSAFDFDEETEKGVVIAHTDMATLLFAESVEGDERFGSDEAGIVVGIDTAEQY